MTCFDSTTDAQPEFFAEPHDPSGKTHGPYRFLIQCATGVQVIAATVAIVDESGYPIPFDATGVEGDSLVISDVSFALATDQTKPNVWAVSFFVTNGSPKVYRVRCRYDLNTTPATGDDLTQLLICKQK